MLMYCFSLEFFLRFISLSQLVNTLIMMCLGVVQSCFLSVLNSWICGDIVMPPQSVFWDSHCTYVRLFYVVPHTLMLCCFLFPTIQIISITMSSGSPIISSSVSNLFFTVCFHFQYCIFTSRLSLWFKSHLAHAFLYFLEHVEHIYNSYFNVLVYSFYHL